MALQGISGFNITPSGIPITQSGDVQIGQNGQKYGDQTKNGLTYDASGSITGVPDSYYVTADKPKPAPSALQTYAPLVGAGLATGGAYAAATQLPSIVHGVGDLFSNPVANATNGTGTATAGGGGTGSGLLAPNTTLPTQLFPGANPATSTAASAAAPTAINTGGSTLGSTASGLWGTGGAQTAGQGLLGATGASPLLAGAGILAGGATGFGQLAGLNDFAKGNSLSLPEEAALALPTFGLSFAANPIEDLLGIGHGENYYAGKDRSAIIDQLSGGSGLLSFPTDDGSTYDLSSDAFRKDPSTYNYLTPDELVKNELTDSQQSDIGAANAAAYLAGLQVGSKKFTDLSGALANAHKSGVSTSDIFSTIGLPSDHDTLYADVVNAVNSGKLDKETGDKLRNGLDQSFGVGAYAPGGSASSSSGTKQKGPITR